MSASEQSCEIGYEAVNRGHSWWTAPDEVKRRWRARYWCIAKMLDRSWFYHDEPIPAWVPDHAMQQS